MNRVILAAVLFIIAYANIPANQTRTIKKTFKVEEGQSITLEKFSGVNLKISTWDRDEISFDLKAVIDCSDEDYELEYANSLAIVNSISGNEQVFRLSATTSESGYYLFGLIKINLFYHFRKEIRGEIFLPKNKLELLQVNYSDIYLFQINNLLEISGRGNDILMHDCSGIERIINPYGKIRIEKCSGDLRLASRGTSIDIIDYKGNVAIESDYSKIKLSNINGIIDVENKSGDVEIRNSNVNKLKIPYTKLEMQDVNLNYNSTISIEGKSSTFYMSNIKSNLEIESDFSAFRLRRIEGITNIKGKTLDIKGDELAGNIFITSTNSLIDIRFSKIKEGIISNTSASINLHLLADPQFLELANHSAPITLTIPPNYDGDLEVKSYKGQINSDFFMDVRKNNTEISGYVKGKAKKRILISNSGSSINLQK